MAALKMKTLSYYWLLLILLFLSPHLLHLATAQQPSHSSSDGNDYANPSLAVIVIVIVLVFFVTGFISVYIHLCSDASSAVSAASTTVAAAGLSKRGIEKSVIETFPTFLYSEVKELKYGKDSLECAVCLNEFQEDDTLRLLPKCDHVFHSECIDAWLDGHSTCPVCRANLLPDPNDNNNNNFQRESRFNAEEGLPSGERILTVEEVRIPISEEEKENLKLNQSKFPRSHSTGHSLSRPGEDSERFTLKLPAEVRRQLVARSKLKRATSQLNLPRASSSRRGYRGGGGGEGSGSSRYGGLFGRSISKVVSFKWTLPKVRADGDVTEVGKGSKTVLDTAVTPLEELHSPLPV